MLTPHAQRGTWATPLPYTAGNLGDKASLQDLDRFSDDEEDETAQLLELVGRGAFGSVFKAQYRGKLAAVKVVEHDEELLASTYEIQDYVREGTSSAYASGSSSRHHALLEGAVSSVLAHPHVLQTYDWQPADSGPQSALLTSGCRETRIVMEWCDAGSLSDALQDGRLQVLGPDGLPGLRSLEAAATTLLEVACALQYLHHMHVVHCDLKPTNVLLASSQADARGFTAKVSDFGLSRLFSGAKGSTPGSQPSAQSSPGAGTVTHMAPECLSGGQPAFAGDVFAFGILMWEVYMGRRKPYGQLSKVQIMVGVMDGLRPTFPPGTPSWYSALAAACWAKPVRQRPTGAKLAARLQQHVAQLRQEVRQAEELASALAQPASRRARAALQAAAAARQQ